MTTRRRPHPARRARRVVGASSAVGVLALTGSFALHQVATTATTTTAGATSTATAVRSTSGSSGLSYAATAAVTTSATPSTTSHGS